MKYKAKALIEDNKIKCLSQMCTPDCPNYFECEDVEVEIKEVQ